MLNTMLFQQLIEPIVLTNASIWGHHSKLLTIQHKALRFLVWVGMPCPIAGMFGEIPLKIIIKASPIDIES